MLLYLHVNFTIHQSLGRMKSWLKMKIRGLRARFQRQSCDFGSIFKDIKLSMSHRCDAQFISLLLLRVNNEYVVNNCSMVVVLGRVIDDKSRCGR